MPGHRLIIKFAYFKLKIVFFIKKHDFFSLFVIFGFKFPGVVGGGAPCRGGRVANRRVLWQENERYEYCLSNKPIPSF
jgi:hypothetical protein